VLVDPEPCRLAVGDQADAVEASVPHPVDDQVG
jgi:hypothetical protein